MSNIFLEKFKACPNCGHLENPDKKPKVVVLCGSSRFVDIMAVCAYIIERDEQAIVMSLHLLPNWYSFEPIPDHLAEHEGVAKAMDELHLRKIDIADEIFVVNYEHYVGDSTANEVRYAQNLSKAIRWFTDDRVGRIVDGKIKRFLKLNGQSE